MPSDRFPAQYAILGSLMEEEIHGYELHQRLSSAIGPIWHIATSQLYLTLHRLEERGLLSVRVEVQENRPPRKVYAVTTEGEEAFWDWVTLPVRHVRDMRVELLAKLYFLHRLAPERTTLLIDREINFLKRLYDRLFRRNNLPAEDRTFGGLVLQFRLGQVESAIRWLGECREQLTPTSERRIP